MHQWLKRAVLVCGIFIAVWIGMAMYWNTNNRLPSSSEVIIFLGLVPLVLVLAAVLSLKIIATAMVKPISDTSAAASERANNDPNVIEKQDIRADLIILASSIRAPHGDSSDELAQALVSNQGKLVLDEELTDLNGFPILSGRIQSVEEESQRKALSKWGTSCQLPVISWSTEQLRALSIASTIIDNLLLQAMTHPLLPSYMAADYAQRPSIALPILQLFSVLPLHWNDEHRQIATKWFLHLIEEHGWPLERISISQASSADHAQPFLMIEQLTMQSHRQGFPCFSLLIACESLVGAQTVLDWEQAVKLLTASNEYGQVPGEGAAGFLIVDIEQARLMRVEGMARMHQAFSARREKSADVRGRIDTGILERLTQQALASAAIPAKKIALLAADTDHRGSRAGELIGMASTTFADLDLKTQCYKVAACCGFAGVVSSLTALALAHHAVMTNDNPTLCISNQDEFECSAVVVSPIADEAMFLGAPA
jgi:hypothetical protein